MTDQFKGEKGPTPENSEDQKYTALQSAMDEQEEIMEGIKNVFETMPDRAEAEKIVLGKYASQMDEAMRKSRQALDKWLIDIKKPDEK